MSCKAKVLWARKRHRSNWHERHHRSYCFALGDGRHYLMSICCATASELGKGQVDRYKEGMCPTNGAAASLETFAAALGSGN